MIYELEDTAKAASIFEGWEETLIYSCIQKIMGKIYVTDPVQPRSACAFVGCFAFYAGKPDEELVKNKPGDFVIMTPQNEEWAKVIEKCYPMAKRVTRYATRKDTKFDILKLQDMVKQLPEGYELRKIDGDIYDQCLQNPETADFVSVFGSKDKYLEYGKGFVILKGEEIQVRHRRTCREARAPKELSFTRLCDPPEAQLSAGTPRLKVVSGASSYSRYKEGIEIEVDTIETERRKHRATAACAALILECLKENLYPSWDAQNINSVRLAEKLGYEFAHEYVAYEV